MRAETKLRWILIGGLALANFNAVLAVPPPPLPLNKFVDLNQKGVKGNTFFDVMDKTIKPLFDADENGDDGKGGSFNLADKDVIKASMANFEDQLPGTANRPYARALSYYNDGEKGFNELIDALIPGTIFNPATFRGDVMDRLKLRKLLKPGKDPQRDPTGMAASTSAALLALASRSGTTIVINEQNYMYGLGYRTGGQKNDQKTGRNFAASMNHKALDPSDKFFLNELQNYLKATKDPSPFFRAAMKILTKTDTAGLSDIDPMAQTVLADCLTIYVAELDRHLMSDLKSHEWENDLFEVTLLAPYSVASGKIASRNGLVPGNLEDYYAEGPTGGGIGDTRDERRDLQRQLSAATKKFHAETVQKLEELTQIPPDSDVMMGLMRHLNNRSTQDQVKANAAEIIETTTAFALFLRSDADKLTMEINPQ